MKYCTKCKQKFIDDGFTYCPLCAATLISIVELESGLYQLGDLIEEDSP